MINCTYKEMADRLKEYNDILLFPHINLDGDAIGSTMALALALRKLGKNASVLLFEAVPKFLDFLIYDPATKDQNIYGDAELVMMVDCGNLNRIRFRDDAFMRGRTKAIIDHHATNDRNVDFDFGIVEPDSAATAELIYCIIKELGVEIDLDIATCLWAGITTDTGDFQFNSTTPRSHRIAGELIQTPGLDSRHISYMLYERNSFEALKLESYVIDTLKKYKQGRIIVGHITMAMTMKANCRMDETEGFIRRLMGIEGCEIGCLLKENTGSIIRVSFRSKGDVDVSMLAKQFGGGGHKNAAGCTLNTSMAEAEEMIVKALQDYLE